MCLESMLASRRRESVVLRCRWKQSWVVGPAVVMQDWWRAYTARTGHWRDGGMLMVMVVMMVMLMMILILIILLLLLLLLLLWVFIQRKSWEKN